jgi:hypothetical protein
LWLTETEDDLQDCPRLASCLYPYSFSRWVTCAGYLGHSFRKRHLESDLLVLLCLWMRSGIARIREHAGISYVDTLLFSKEHSVFPVRIPLRQRLALCFHALRDGIIRWVNPCSTSPLLGTITDLAEGKSDFWTDVPGSQHRIVAPAFLVGGGSRHMFLRFVAASHQLFSR